MGRRNFSQTILTIGIIRSIQERTGGPNRFLLEAMIEIYRKVAAAVQDHFLRSRVELMPTIR